MLRLNNLYQSTKKHTGKIVAGALIIGALAGIRSCAKNMGEEVYRGNINGQEVVYEEGRFTLKASQDFQKNVMRVQNGVASYILEDITDETDVDYKNNSAPTLGSAKLEKVILEQGESRRAYHRADISSESLDGVHTQKVFDNADKMYNHIQPIIREQLRENYQKQLQSVESAFE